MIAFLFGAGLGLAAGLTVGGRHALKQLGRAEYRARRSTVWGR